MPCEYEIDKSKKIIHIRFTGNITAETILEHAKTVYADEDYHSSYSGILDMTDCQLDMYYADLVKMTRAINGHPSKSRGPYWAMVVSSASDYGVVRMFDALMEQPERNFIIFYDRQEAMDWLINSLKKISGQSETK